MAKVKSAYGRGRRKPRPVDVHVGVRVRARRTLLGMTQTDLGDAIGMTFQQVQKYENGKNRISSSRLYELSQVLDEPIEYFFDDMPPKIAARSPAKRPGGAKEPVRYDPSLMVRRETLEFVRAFYKIENAGIRKRMRDMIAVLGAADA